MNESSLNNYNVTSGKEMSPNISQDRLEKVMASVLSAILDCQSIQGSFKPINLFRGVDIVGLHWVLSWDDSVKRFLRCCNRLLSLG